MKKIMLAVPVVAAVLAAGGSALGGLQLGPQGVMIDTSDREASGSLGGAQLTSSTSEYIGCGFSASTATGLSYLTCSARNAAGIERSCYTNAPIHFAVWQSATADSAIEFAWDLNNVCRYLYVGTASFNATKKHF